MLPPVGTCAAALPTSDGVINGVSEIRFEKNFGRYKKICCSITINNDNNVRLVEMGWLGSHPEMSDKLPGPL